MTQFRFKVSQPIEELKSDGSGLGLFAEIERDVNIMAEMFGIPVSKMEDTPSVTFEKGVMTINMAYDADKDCYIQ